MAKLGSRKFWLAVAAFLGSVAAGLSGVADAEVCAVCMALSAGVYAACEAYVDGKGAASNVTTTTLSASTTSKETVERMLGGERE